ncbi:polysaccharide biosynthesis protein, partial [Clostridium botulinum]|nr:polysaccharide biosynthesis protein [Clostridium botulinum]
RVMGVSIATIITNIIYSAMQYLIFLKILNQRKGYFNIMLKAYYKFILFVIILLIISTLKINYYIYIMILLASVFMLYKKDINDVVKKYI